MERINVTPLSKTPIPAICDKEGRTETESPPRADTLASNWLSSAMAIWLRDDEGVPRPVRQEAPPTTRLR